MFLKSSALALVAFSVISLNAQAHDHFYNYGHMKKGTPSTSTQAQTPAPAPAEWDYSNPAKWTGTCGTGTTQSPVNLVNASFDSTLSDLNLNWQQNDMQPHFNGHTIEVPYAATSGISFKGMEIPLKQFHFHSPSEHTINGKQFAMEIHFVHQDAAGKTLVVGVLVDSGKFNAALGDVFDSRTDSAQNLLPASMNYYNYNGSLTTPPCTEGVTWIVMKEAIEAAPEQIAHLIEFTKGPNNRPVQPLNGRTIGTNEI